MLATRRLSGNWGSGRKCCRKKEIQSCYGSDYGNFLVAGRKTRLSATKKGEASTTTTTTSAAANDDDDDGSFLFMSKHRSLRSAPPYYS